MYVKVFCGAMWSGKTSTGLEYVKQYRRNGKSVACFDHPSNSRNSERDLTVRDVSSRKLAKFEDLSKYDLVFFDEIHLYDVFQEGRQAFLDSFATCRGLVVLTGIYFDFYKQYRPFQIYSHLALCPTVQGWEMHNLSSIEPCQLCQGAMDVFYTANDCSSNSRVGDHYYNVCSKCKDEAYQRWEEAVSVKQVLSKPAQESYAEANQRI